MCSNFYFGSWRMGKGLKRGREEEIRQRREREVKKGMRERGKNKLLALSVNDGSDDCDDFLQRLIALMKKENKRARCSLTVWEWKRRIKFSRERESSKSWKWGSRKEIKKRKGMRSKEIKRGERCLKNVWNNESLFLLSFSGKKCKNREREREERWWEMRGEGKECN